MAEGHYDQDHLLKATRGEQLTFRWLEDSLPASYLLWHEPWVAGARPDLVVFGPKIGLLVLEVKDWSSGSIQSVDKHIIHIAKGSSGDYEAKTHPVEQAKRHIFKISDALKKWGACSRQESVWQGKLPFPWNAGAILPNMTRSEMENLRLGEGHAPGAILCRDDIGTPGAWVTQGNDLVERLLKVGTVGFAWNINPQIKNAVISTLEPHTNVGVGFAGRARKKDGAEAADSDQKSLPLDLPSSFTEQQRKFAKDLKGGHQILHGVAGGGKSEVVAARAQILAEAKPAARILVLCYNIALAGWLRSRIFRTGLLQGHNLRVLHFHAWGRELLDRAGIRYSRKIYERDDGFEGLVLESFESGKISQRWDAILIDEGQDFTPTMVRAALSALAKGRDDFLFAMDNAQRIYETSSPSLRKLGIQHKGSPGVLKQNLRCTAEINRFANQFLWGDIAEGEAAPSRGESIWVPVSSDRSGKPVGVFGLASLKEQAEFAAARCRELMDDGFLPDEIAVLYRRPATDASTPPADPVPLLMQAFKDECIDLFWLARDQTSKSDAAIDPAAVTLSTIPSFKGLEARAIILVGADQSAASLEQNPREKASLYVAMTRATDALTITWSNPDGIGPHLARLA